MMKKLTLGFLASLALVASSFAGKEIKDFKTPVEPCFKDTELQLDVFGSYSGAGANGGDFGDGFGGGIGVNYFFTRNFGVSTSGNVYDGDHDGIWHVSFDLIARFPIEGNLCIAPYALVGGGFALDGTQIGTWEVGGGLEWRATHSIGLFSEGRFIWGGNNTDVAQARVGVRFVF